jgi:atypical dual specificity phosphatase
MESPPVRTLPPDVPPSRFPEALAARIGDRELWIANGGAVRPTNLDALNLNPEYVVSVNRTATDATTDHHPLKDGYLNPQDKFTAAVEAARKRLQQDGTTIVNCAAGVSRSSTIIATAIAAEDEVAFKTALEEIRQTRERAYPHTKLQVSAQAYLASIENREEATTELEKLAKGVSLDPQETKQVVAADELPTAEFEELSDHVDID